MFVYFPRPCVLYSQVMRASFQGHARFVPRPCALCFQAMRALFPGHARVVAVYLRSDTSIAVLLISKTSIVLMSIASFFVKTFIPNFVASFLSLGIAISCIRWMSFSVTSAKREFTPYIGHCFITHLPRGAWILPISQR